MLKKLIGQQINKHCQKKQMNAYIQDTMFREEIDKYRTTKDRIAKKNKTKAPHTKITHFNINLQQYLKMILNSLQNPCSAFMKQGNT